MLVSLAVLLFDRKSDFLTVSGVPLLYVKGADDRGFALFGHFVIFDGVPGFFFSFKLYLHKRYVLLLG